LTKLEKSRAGLPWRKGRPGVDVKLLAKDEELYVLAQSRARIANERAMRRRQLKRLWARLKCKILDLRFQALPDELTACHSSLGGEFGEWIDVVKDASIF
jgi:hypothetical protein